MIGNDNKKLLFSSIFMSLFLLGCDSKFEMTKTEITKDDSGITQSVVSRTTTDNNETITHIKVDNSSSSSSNIGSISMDGNTIDFKNDNMYINGKKVDTDNEYGANIITQHNKKVVNGQTVENNNENQKNISIILTGKTVKIPVTYLHNLSSSFNINQKCSDDNTSYFLIDSALQPYIVTEKANSGLLILNTGNYKIKGTINVQLYTPPLKELDYNSYGNMNISCIDKSNFSLVNNGIGKIIVDKINTENVHVSQLGSGIINLQGNNINT